MEERKIDWSDKAACAGCDDPDIFFPEGVKSMFAAVQFCQRCEARQDCLNFAIENKIVYGIWGGRPPHKRFTY